MVLAKAATMDNGIANAAASGQAGMVQDFAGAASYKLPADETIQVTAFIAGTTPQLTQIPSFSLAMTTRHVTRLVSIGQEKTQLAKLLRARHERT